MRERPDLNRLGDDGTDRKVTVEELQELFSDVDQIRNTLEDIGSMPDVMEDLRYCRWAGQSTDGRKWKDKLGVTPKPFDGCSDARLPVCDGIVNTHVAEYMNAAARAVPRVKGMDGTDEALAGKIGTLVKYVIRNVWGRQYRRNLEIISNYMEADYPAAGLMEVYWRRERGIRYETIDAYSLVNIYYQFAQNLPEDANTDAFVDDLLDVVENPDRAEDLKQLIGMIHPHLKAGRLNKLVRQFYADGVAEFPVPYIRENSPQIRPLRLNVNCFIQSNVRDLNRASGIYVIEHLTRSEVEERAMAEGWSRAFLDELVGKDGEEGAKGSSAFWDSAVLADNEFLNLYEVVRGYKYAANEDGATAICRYTFSKFCSVAAKPREMMRNWHGGMPFVDFVREHLTDKLLDSRPVQHISGTQQHSLKRIHDSYEDHVQTKINPPLISAKNAPSYRLQLAPFGQLEMTGREKPSYLEGPDYPRAADKHVENIRKELAEYWGLPHKEVGEDMVIMFRQARVDNFLASLADVLKMTTQLCLQYWSDEELTRIVGGKGLQMLREVEEVIRCYDFEFSFDVRDMNMEYIVKKAEIAMKYAVALDERATIRKHVLAGNILQSVDPNWADAALVDVEVADEREQREALAEFGQWLNGIETPLKENGVNAALRLQVIQQELVKRQQNPEAFAPLSPAAQAIIENNMKNLQFIIQQQQNAQTGRTGAEESVFNQGGAA